MEKHNVVRVDYINLEAIKITCACGHQTETRKTEAEARADQEAHVKEVQ